MKPVAKSRGGGPSNSCKECSRKAAQRWRDLPGSAEKIHESGVEWRKNNPEKVRRSKKDFRQRNPEKTRAGVRKCHEKSGRRYTANAFENWLWKNYKLPLDDWLYMNDVQLDRCAICQTDDLDGNRSKLCIDHDHETGKVRGLLCFNCNTMLGNAKDKIETLQRAIEYLQDPNPFSRTFKTFSYLSKNDLDLKIRILTEQCLLEQYEEQPTDVEEIESVFA